MESVEGSVVVLVVYARVVKIEYLFGQWYMHLEGSHESIGIGEDKIYEVGDKIKITFERIADAKPSQPPV